MKKHTAGIAAVAALGFSALAMAPASAAGAPIVFDNCTQAASFGVYNIPAGMPGYGPHLDSDSDGIGCENATYAYDAKLVPVETAPGEYQHEIVDRVPSQQPPQIGQMPVGGADTGVTVEETTDVGGLALGGGLALAAAAGAAVVVRRRAVRA